MSSWLQKVKLYPKCKWVIAKCYTPKGIEQEPQNTLFLRLELSGITIDPDEVFDWGEKL